MEIKNVSDPDKQAAIENTIYYSTEFDYDSVDGIDGPQEPSINEIKKTAVAFASVLEWVTAGGRGKARGMLTRMRVFIWCVHPYMFRSMTQTEVAAKFGIGTAAFSKEVSSFRDTFNFKSARMRTEENRKASQAGQKRKRKK